MKILLGVLAFLLLTSTTLAQEIHTQPLPEPSRVVVNRGTGRTTTTPTPTPTPSIQTSLQKLQAPRTSSQSTTGILWDSGVVRAYVNQQNVWTAQYWKPCSAPLDAYQCPERIYFPDYWIAALAVYETTWVACDPSSYGSAGMMCIESYIRYAAYLKPFIDAFPGTFELKPPKPIPACLDFPQIGFTCPRG